MIGRRGWSAALCALALVLVSCEREVRPFQDLAVASARSQRPVLSPIFPGGQPPPAPNESPFQNNAYGLSEGKRLFDSYNCSGCHAHGGGGMGPALMDDTWIYGSSPGNIFETIVEGRPNGMPAFAGKIPDSQVWQLVAYVQSMSGNAPIAALPGRSDHLHGGTPENGRPAQRPIQTQP
jgi:cytochrome c oxidase cbb3-type subunit 3